jgi:hypothetical protein
MVVSGKGGAVLDYRNFCLRAVLSLEVSQVRSEDKMASFININGDIIVLSPRTPAFVTMQSFSSFL